MIPVFILPRALQRMEDIYYIADNENAIYVATVWDCRQNPDKLQYEVIYN